MDVVLKEIKCPAFCRPIIKTSWLAWVCALA